MLWSSSAADGVRGEARAFCFKSNQEMNLSRILPGITRAIDVLGCLARCLYTMWTMSIFFVDLVDFDLTGRIVGVSPYHPHARTGVVLLTETCAL